MTSFLTSGMGGIGGQGTPTTDTRALQAIDSQTKGFVNKDFVKNIAWLNNSVDTLSQWSQKLQKGVDQANQNALEQIQGIYADLFVMFAGLEPTGIHIGDLKYVIQGLGALLGIDPDTPFPINLIEAAWHLFSNYIVPAPQFLDVIFDAVDAWGVELGLSPEFMDSMNNLRESFENLATAISTSMDGLFDAFSKLLAAFMPTINSLGPYWDALVNLIDVIPWEAATPVIQLLADLGIPFIDALTAIVNAGTAFLTPLSFISGSQIGSLGTNFVPVIGNQTTLWSLGAAGAQATAWVFDSTQSASGTDGSLTTLGNGTAKEVHTQSFFPANPGAKFTVKGKLRWAGIPTGANDFGVQLQWYLDANPVSVTNLNIPSGHGASGGFAESVNVTDVVVPINVNKVRVGARVGTGITTGQVWADEITAQLQGGISTSLIDGLDALLGGFLPLDIFDGLLGGPTTSTGLIDYFSGFLTGNDPLDALNLFNIGNLFGVIPISHLGQDSPEMLENAGFREAISLQGGGIWIWDSTDGRTVPGCASVTANGSVRQLVSNLVRVTEGDELTLAIWAKWASLAYTGTNPIKLQVIRLLYDPVTETYATMDVDDVATIATPAANQATWQQISNTSYTIPVGCSHIALQLVVDDNATAGTVKFDDGSVKKFGLIKQDWVSGLVSSLQEGLDYVESLGQTIFNGITGGTSGGDLFTDIVNALQAIPFPHVQGTGGPANIGGSIQETWNQFVGGLVGALGSGAGLADLFNVGQQVSSAASRGAMAFDLAGIRNNRSFSSGMLATSTSSIDLPQVAIGTVAPTFALTQSTAITLYERIGQSDTCGVVRWMGSGVTNITHFFVNIYKMDPLTGVNTLIHASANIIGDVGAVMTTNKYLVPVTIQQEPGEIWGYELSIRGTGTHNVVGAPTWIHDDPDVFPRRMSSVRNSGTSAPPASFTPTYASNIPFIEVGIEVAGTPLPHQPDTRLVNTVGTQTIPVPSWANFVDRIPCGGGGGGHVGSTWGINGIGGDAGVWNADTRSRAAGHFTDGQSVSVTVPPPAQGGNNASVNGHDGGSVAATLNGNTITATGGRGGDNISAGGGDMQGESPGPFTYNGIPYAGGGQQNTFGANGAPPGGGGAGGNYVSFQSGGDGAIGYCWIVFRQ